MTPERENISQDETASLIFIPLMMMTMIHSDASFCFPATASIFVNKKKQKNQNKMVWLVCGFKARLQMIIKPVSATHAEVSARKSQQFSCDPKSQGFEFENDF